MQANISMFVGGPVNLVCNVNGQTTLPFRHAKRKAAEYVYEIDNDQIDGELVKNKRFKSGTSGSQIASSGASGNWGIRTWMDGVAAVRSNGVRTNDTRGSSRRTNGTRSDIMHTNIKANSNLSTADGTQAFQRSASPQRQHLDTFVPWKGRIAHLVAITTPLTQSSSRFTDNTASAFDLVNHITHHWNPCNQPSRRLHVLIPSHLHPFATTLGIFKYRLTSVYSWDTERLTELALFAQEAEFDGVVACLSVVSTTERRGGTEFLVGDVREARRKYALLKWNERQIQELRSRGWSADEETAALSPAQQQPQRESLKTRKPGPHAAATRLHNILANPSHHRNPCFKRPSRNPNNTPPHPSSSSPPHRPIPPNHHLPDAPKRPLSRHLPKTPPRSARATRLQTWINEVPQSPAAALRVRRDEAWRLMVHDSPIVDPGGGGAVADERATVGDSKESAEFGLDFRAGACGVVGAAAAAAEEEEEEEEWFKRLPNRRLSFGGLLDVRQLPRERGDDGEVFGEAGVRG